MESPLTLQPLSSSSHDPGGRVRLVVDSSVTSSAIFSSCGRYRSLLTRTWDATRPPVMFVGMNPSTADHTHDDPTVRKESAYARMWGYGGLIKCNVMDYRCTNPKGLLAADVQPCSEANLTHIQAQLSNVTHVIAAWGRLPPALKIYATSVEKLILSQALAMVCVGYNLDGSPKHPLYVRSNVTPLPYPRRD